MYARAYCLPACLSVSLSLPSPEPSFARATQPVGATSSGPASYGKDVFVVGVTPNLMTL